MKQQYVIGVDIGTTSTKAVLFKVDGEAVEVAYESYPLMKDTPDMAEQDLDDIFAAVLDSVRNVVKQAAVSAEEILCVSFSSAMHSLILMDKNHKALTRSITWADNRAADWAEWLKKGKGKEIYHRTGTPIHPMSPLAKIIWLREEQPEIFNKAEKFIGVKEYVFYQLFGEYVVDFSVASSTGLFNIHDFKWDTLAMETAGIKENQLPRLGSPTAQMTGMMPEYAERMGLLADTPFVLGGSDGCLSNLGVGAMEAGAAAVTIGTSGAVRMVTSVPYTDSEERTFCYVLDEEHWVIGGAVNNGGVLLDWASKQYLQEEQQQAVAVGQDAYDFLMEKIDSVPAGSKGLIFHPYLNGERAPLWDADARGSFSGINMMHQPEHFLRAVLEGVCMNLFDVLHELMSLAGKPTRIMATGGFSRSPVWRQMLTDVFNQELTLPDSFESSCFGAAMYGLKSVGVLEDIAEAKDRIGSQKSHSPNEEASAVYRSVYPVYRRLSRVLAEEYHMIADFQQKLG